MQGWAAGSAHACQRRGAAAHLLEQRHGGHGRRERGHGLLDARVVGAAHRVALRGRRRVGRLRRGARASAPQGRHRSSDWQAGSARICGGRSGCAACVAARVAKGVHYVHSSRERGSANAAARGARAWELSRAASAALAVASAALPVPLLSASCAAVPAASAASSAAFTACRPQHRRQRPRHCGASCTSAAPARLPTGHIQLTCTTSSPAEQSPQPCSPCRASWPVQGGARGGGPRGAPGGLG